MRVLVICCLAFALFFAICGVASGSEVDTLKKYIGELQERCEMLESLLMQTVDEASPIFQQAEALVAKKKGDFTCEEKLILISAAYYEMKLRLILSDVELTNLELNSAVARLKSLKEA